MSYSDIIIIFTAEDAFCGTPVNAIRNAESTNTAVRGAEDEYICCKDSNIAKGYVEPADPNTDDFDKCSDFKTEGYRYATIGETFPIRILSGIMIGTLEEFSDWNFDLKILCM